MRRMRIVGPWDMPDNTKGYTLVMEWFDDKGTAVLVDKRYQMDEARVRIAVCIC